MKSGDLSFSHFHKMSFSTIFTRGHIDVYKKIKHVAMKLFLAMKCNRKEMRNNNEYNYYQKHPSVK